VERGWFPARMSDLAEERDRLKSSTVLEELAGGSLELMRTNVTDNVSEIRKNMEHAASLDKVLQPLADRIISACYEIEDFEIALRDYLEALPGDPQRLEDLNERIALIKQLQRKYGPTLENVIEHGRRVENELESLDGVEREIADLHRRLEILNREVLEKAGELSRLRSSVARKLSSSMGQELQSLGFSHPVFDVAIHAPSEMNIDSLQHTGGDQVEFLFSANPG
jgi:DNA repair protein RecN (Recombination protein N)